MIKNLLTKIGIVLIMSLSIGCSWAQSITGNVYSTLNFGTVDYSYIIDSERGVFYKTSAFQTGLLTVGDEVTMIIDPDNHDVFNIQVKKKTAEIIICYAARVKTESFVMPINSVYDMPILENRILFFKDQNHFDEFYKILNDFSTSQFEEQRDLLTVFESQYLGFTSFNDYLESTHNWEDGEFFEDELVNRHEIDFFKDYLIKSLCNQFAEIGIGNKVYTMFRNADDECVSISIDKAKESLITEKRVLNFDHLLNFAIINNLDVYHGGEKVFGKRSQVTYVIGKDNYDLDVTLKYYDASKANNVDCSIYEKTFYVGIIRDCNDMEFIDINSFAATVSINWGDGTITNHNFPSFTGQNLSNSSSVSPSHTYNAVGTYYISYILNFTTEDSPSKNVTFIGEQSNVKVGSICAEKSVNAPARRISITDTYSMLCDAWINNWFTYKCVGSATEAWRKKNNGKLVKENGNIQCSITAVYRDDNCTEYANAFEYDSKHGKHVQTIVTKWFRKFDVGNGDTYSFNYYERNNAIATTNIPLNPCD